jgi:hypothetical protein
MASESSDREPSDRAAQSTGGGEANRLAQEGVSTPRQLNRVTGGLLRDVLGGRVQDRTARTAAVVIRTMHKGAKLATELGENSDVFGLPPLDQAPAQTQPAGPCEDVDEVEEMLVEEQIRVAEQLREHQRKKKGR